MSVACLLLGLAAPLSAGAPALAASSPTAADLRRAAEMSEEARRLFAQRRFADAAEIFLRAYALSSEPTQLANAASAYLRAQKLVEARAQWQRYLTLNGLRPEERAEAQREIAKLDAYDIRATALQLESARARDQAVEGWKAYLSHPGTDEAGRAEAKSHIAALTQPNEPVPAGIAAATTWPAYVSFGAGGILLATSTILWLDRQDSLDSLDAKLAQTNPAGRIVGIDRGSAQSRLDEANTSAAWAVMTGIGGLAAAGFGLYWYLDEDDRPAHARARHPRRRSGFVVTPGSIGWRKSY